MTKLPNKAICVQCAEFSKDSDEYCLRKGVPLHAVLECPLEAEFKKWWKKLDKTHPFNHDSLSIQFNVLEAAMPSRAKSQAEKEDQLPFYSQFWRYCETEIFPTQPLAWDLQNKTYRRYEQGVWEKFEAEQVEKWMFAWAEEAEEDLSAADVAICHKYLKSHVYISANKWNNAPNRICCENGMVNLLTKQLEPWAPEWYCTYKFHANFLVTPPETPYLDRIRNTYPDAFFALERFLQAIIWYDLTNEMMMCLNGPTNSGKGTILNLVSTLLKDVSAKMDLYQLGDKNYSYTGIINKRVLLDKDSRFQTLNQFALAAILKLTGLDTMDGQNVNAKYIPHYETELKVFILLATNQFAQLPLGTTMQAFFRRVWIIQFDKIQKSDPGFKENVKKDLDGWFSELILMPYHRWKTPQFNLDEWGKTMSAIWDYSANPYKRYVREMFERVDNMNGSELDQDDVMDWIRQRLFQDKYVIPNDLYLKQLITSEMAGIRVRKKQRKYFHYYYPVQVKKDWEKWCDITANAPPTTTNLDAVIWAKAEEIAKANHGVNPTDILETLGPLEGLTLAKIELCLQDWVNIGKLVDVSVKGEEAKFELPMKPEKLAAFGEEI